MIIDDLIKSNKTYLDAASDKKDEIKLAEKCGYSKKSSTYTSTDHYAK